MFYSLSLLTFSPSTIQVHSLPLTTPSVLPPLHLPPVCGDFPISTNFLPNPAMLAQNIRRWKFVELNQLLPNNLVRFLNQDSELGDQKLPPIKDIPSWCLAMLLYTAKTGVTLAYMASILQTSNNYAVKACFVPESSSTLSFPCSSGLPVTISNSPYAGGATGISDSDWTDNSWTTWFLSILQKV